jgi:hypothetical protein
MLTYKDIGIKKFILDRLNQIDDEIVNIDPEYKKLGERLVRSVKFEGRSVKLNQRFRSSLLSWILGFWILSF